MTHLQKVNWSVQFGRNKTGRGKFQSWELHCRRKHVPIGRLIEIQARRKHNELIVCDVKVGPGTTLKWSTLIVCNLSMLRNRFIGIAIVYAIIERLLPSIQWQVKLTGRNGTLWYRTGKVLQTWNGIAIYITAHWPVNNFSYSNREQYCPLLKIHDLTGLQAYIISPETLRDMKSELFLSESGTGTFNCGPKNVCLCLGFEMKLLDDCSVEVINC